MAGFLIWVPGEPGRTEKDAKVLLGRAGLADLLRADDAAPMVVDALTPEPEGDRCGQLVYWDEPAIQPIGLHPEKQTWRRLTPRDGLARDRGWVGWWNDRPPGPGCLARKKAHAGEELKLCDGRKWQIPAMRHLPQAMCFDDDGQVAMQYVDARYVALAEKVSDAFGRTVADMQAVGEGETLKAQFPLREFLYLGAEMLGLNYRLNVDLVGMLQLLGNDSMGVLFAAAGAPRDWWEEKKSAESTSAGAAG